MRGTCYVYEKNGYIDNARWLDHPFAPPNARLGDDLKFIYYGESDDFQRRKLGHGESKLLAITRGEHAENALRTLFRDYAPRALSGRRLDQSRVYVHDDIYAAVAYLLMVRMAVPSDEFEKDLPKDCRLESFLQNKDMDYILAHVAKSSLFWRDGIRRLDTPHSMRDKLDVIRTDPDEMKIDVGFYLVGQFPILIRAVLGDEFCDPLTSLYANSRHMFATTCYTKDDDGLKWTSPWGPKVFLNPDTPQREPAFIRLAAEVRSGNTTEAVVYNIPNSLGAKYYRDSLGPLVSAIYFPYGRDDMRVSVTYGLEDGTSNPEGCHCFLYIGPDPRRFLRIFSSYHNGGHGYEVYRS